MRITLTGGWCWWLLSSVTNKINVSEVELRYPCQDSMVEKMNLVTLFFNQYMVLSWNTVS